MKYVLSILLALTLAAPVFAQSSGATATKLSKAVATEPKTVSGRITRLDTKSGLFSVRSNDGKEVVDLVARRDLIAYLRRGERVTVTYQGKTATRIQMTRTGQ